MAISPQMAQNLLQIFPEMKETHKQYENRHCFDIPVTGKNGETISPEIIFLELEDLEKIHQNGIATVKLIDAGIIYLIPDDPSILLQYDNVEEIGKITFQSSDSSSQTNTVFSLRIANNINELIAEASQNGYLFLDANAVKRSAEGFREGGRAL